MSDFNKEIKGFGFKEFDNLEEAIAFYDIIPLEENN